MTPALQTALLTDDGARIGPNAIIQTVAALRARYGDAAAEDILGEATSWHLDALPTAMVDERNVTSLVGAVLARFGDVEGSDVLRESGVRTARYLLHTRIPHLAQVVLRVLPRRMALRLLMASITRHSWTFAGSASFEVSGLTSAGGEFSLFRCPMCRGLTGGTPQCHFYAATVEELVCSIVSPNATVRETECEAAGGARCHFVITL